MKAPSPRNILGGSLDECCRNPVTGFFRDGSCKTGRGDAGLHTVCAIVTEAFLAFSRAQGNDLSTPRTEMGFPGLQPGDRWCLCAARWAEAVEAGVAPPIVPSACDEATLKVVDIDTLRRHALQ